MNRCLLCGASINPDGVCSLIDCPDPMYSKRIAALTINDMQARVFDWAHQKGWTAREVPVPEQCALIHSEVSEALEAWRNNEPISYSDEKGKPVGLASEYADAVIRIMHYCSLNNINLSHELFRKMNYNDTREYRHGGKKG